MALSDASREAIARSQFYGELELTLPPPLLLSDNNSALQISEDPTNYRYAKHIDIKYHFIRHAIHKEQVIIDYIPSTENPADLLTKTLSSTKHQHGLELMKLL